VNNSQSVIVQQRVFSVQCCTQQLYTAHKGMTRSTYVTGSANDSAPARNAFNSLLSPKVY
jgi:hypothetical protein